MKLINPFNSCGLLIIILSLFSLTNSNAQIVSNELPLQEVYEINTATNELPFLYSSEMSKKRAIKKIKNRFGIMDNSGKSNICEHFTGNIIYVDIDAIGMNTGADWANAYNDLQDAIDMTCVCENIEIWVAEGIYLPTRDKFMNSSNAVDDRTNTFYMICELEMYGGFDGTESFRQQRDFMNNITILSGDFADNDVLVSDISASDYPAQNMEENAYTVVHSFRLTNNTIIDGFQIRGGNANDPNSNFPEEGERGGAWFNNGAGIGNSSNPIIQNCAFIQNRATTFGGAMYNLGIDGNASPTLINCTFTNNRSLQSGGGIYNNGNNNGNSNPAFESCNFLGNSSNNSGGAIYNYGIGGNSSPQFENCNFESNRAEISGGAINNFGVQGVSNSQFMNCLFINNIAIAYGGGIYNTGIQGNANNHIENCMFTNNISNLSGGAIYNVGDNGIVKVTAINTLFNKNKAEERGGAFTFDDDNFSVTSEFINCTFADNNATNGGAIGRNFLNSGQLSPSFINCIFWGNNSLYAAVDNSSIIISFSIIEDAEPDGILVLPSGIIDNGNNYDVDPLYNDPNTNDYSLQMQSPAIDVGNNSANNTVEDLASNSRRVDAIRSGTATIDLGAYEFQDVVDFVARCLPAITKELDQNGMITLNATELDNGSTGSNLSFTIDDANSIDYSCEDLANTPFSVTLTVTNEANQSATCNSNITILDKLPPNFTPPADQTIEVDNNCSFAVPNLLTGLTGSDNCSNNITFYQNPSINTVINTMHNETTSITITADDGNGNTVDKVVTITAEDETRPTFTKPETQNVNLNSGCNLMVPDLLTLVTELTDNCSTNISLSQTPTSGTILNSEHNMEHTVAITANDGNGNTTTLVSKIIAQDATAPMVQCKDFTLNLTSSDVYVLSTEDLMMIGEGSMDNCIVDEFMITSGSNAYSCNDVDKTFPIELSVFDVAGNSNVCNANISVTGCEGVLATEIISFSAELNDNSETEIIWQIANELDAAYFDIEYSTDGEQFEVLNTIPASNINRYLEVHNTPAQGYNYYRLKIINTDNSITVSKIVVVFLHFADQIVAYPNPTQQIVTLLLPNHFSSQSNIYIYSGNGQLIQQLVNTNTIQQMDFSSFPAGIYQVMVIDKDLKEFVRIVKE